uniref:Uncharacterized protein At5g19025 isoform X4 n=1 Tax=Cicer arietinum TaxID=3827 RepID=A0A1S3DZW7_CICAR|nr:uncharacterized protein At5g19025 isoform X4 [Cicer arietinum]
MQEGVVLTTAMPSSSSSSSSSSWSHHCNNLCNCKHAPSATLDLLILLLVLFSGAFLLSSYFSYIFNSLSLLLPSISLPIPYIIAFVIFFAVSVFAVEVCCGARSRKCQRSGCRGLKNATEFDLQIERFGSGSGLGLGEYDKLPWKGLLVVVLLQNLKLLVPRKESVIREVEVSHAHTHLGHIELECNRSDWPSTNSNLLKT